MDTTLRDGRQNRLPKHERLEHPSPDRVQAAVRHALLAREFGCRYIDAGVAIANDGGFSRSIVESIARANSDRGDMSILGFTLAEKECIDRTVSAVQRAARRGVALLVSLSRHHLPKYAKHFPGIMRKNTHINQRLNDIFEAKLVEFTDAVAHAASLRRRGDMQDIHVYLEDASRMDIKSLVRATKVLIDAGATSVSYPDTMGVRTPHMYVRMFRDAFARLGDDLIERVLWSAHCHNDFGSAVENTMEVARAGLVQILEVTFGGGGPGEGAGNADGNALCNRLLPAGHEWEEELPPHLQELGLDAGLLLPLNQAASEFLGRKIPDKSSVVGHAAERVTEVGIHSAGELDSEEFRREHPDADVVGMYTHDFRRFGVPIRRRFDVGPWQSKRGMMGAMHERHICVEGIDADHAHETAIRMTNDLGYTLTDEHLQMVAWEARHPEEKRFLQVDFGTISLQSSESSLQTIEFVLQCKDKAILLKGSGTGALAAFVDAIDNFMKENFQVSVDIAFLDPRFELCSQTHANSSVVSPARDAVALLDMRFAFNTEQIGGFGIDANQVYAGCKACLLATNRWLSEKRGHIQRRTFL